MRTSKAAGRLSCCGRTCMFPRQRRFTSLSRSDYNARKNGCIIPTNAREFFVSELAGESTLTSTIGGDDVDLPPEKKDELESHLRREARALLGKRKAKERNR